MSVYNKQKDIIIFPRPLKLLVKAVLALHSHTTDEVILHLVSTCAICKLHLEYFQDPSPTDCISFPIDAEGISTPRILGEIFVCPKTAMEYASKKNLDPYNELALYVIHGLLHCLGYDDQLSPERRKMRLAEKKAMGLLVQKNLYLGPAQ